MSSDKKTFVPPYFKNFGKANKDLFKKKYEFNNSLKVVNKTKNGITLESGANITDSFKGTVNGKYNSKDFGEAEIEISTSQFAESKAQLKLTKLVDRLTATLNYTNKDSESSSKNPADIYKKCWGSADLEYNKDYFSTNAVIRSDLNSSLLKVAASVGVDGLSVGGQVNVNLNNFGVTETGVGIEYSQSDFTASVYSEKNVKTIVAAYFQKLNKETSIGAKVDYQLNDSSRSLQIGVDHQLDADTNVKAKAQFPSGVVSTAVEHKLSNPKVKFGVAAEFDAKNLPLTAQKFGLEFTFGDF